MNKMTWAVILYSEDKKAGVGTVLFKSAKVYESRQYFVNMAPETRGNSILTFIPDVAEVNQKIKLIATK